MGIPTGIGNYPPGVTDNDPHFGNYEEDYDDEEPDEYEEALGNCSGFMDGGFFVCGAAGSEECDWECPFSGDLGKSQKELEEEAGEEVDGPESETAVSQEKP